MIVGKIAADQGFTSYAKGGYVKPCLGFTTPPPGFAKVLDKCVKVAFWLNFGKCFFGGLLNPLLGPLFLTFGGLVNPLPGGGSKPLRWGGGVITPYAGV